MRLVENEFLDHDAIELLKSFYPKRYQALGDILIGADLRGNRAMECLRKLIEFGFVRRTFDWERISQVDTIYYITREGKEIIKRTVE